MTRTIRITVADESGIVLDTLTVKLPIQFGRIAIVPLKTGQECIGATDELVIGRLPHAGTTHKDNP